VRFTVDQYFDADPATVVEAYANPAVYNSLSSLTKVDTPQVVSHLDEGSIVTLEVRYRLVADLPRAVTAVLDPSKITWVQRSRTVRSTGVTTATFVPDHYADKLSASATASVSAHPSGGTRRRVEGEVKVRVPLVGGQVERGIVSGLKEHLAEEATAITAHL
jgi:hypothetical protein